MARKRVNKRLPVTESAASLLTCCLERRFPAAGTAKEIGCSEAAKDCQNTSLRSLRDFLRCARCVKNKKNRPECYFRSGICFLILLWLPVTHLWQFNSAFGF